MLILVIKMNYRSAFSSFAFAQGSVSKGLVPESATLQQSFYLANSLSTPHQIPCHIWGQTNATSLCTSFEDSFYSPSNSIQCDYTYSYEHHLRTHLKLTVEKNQPCQQPFSPPNHMLSHVWGQTNAASVTIHPLKCTSFGDTFEIQPMTFYPMSAATWDTDKANIISWFPGSRMQTKSS